MVLIQTHRQVQPFTMFYFIHTVNIWHLNLYKIECNAFFYIYVKLMELPKHL